MQNMHKIIYKILEIVGITVSYKLLKKDFGINFFIAIKAPYKLGK